MTASVRFRFVKMAESEGFEPRGAIACTVFKTAPL